MISKKEYERLFPKGVAGQLRPEEQSQVDEYQHAFRSNAVERFMREIVHPVLPLAKASSVFSMGHPMTCHTGGKVDGLHSHGQFRRSPYYFTVTKRTRLIHYTSLQGALGILRDGAIRLYSLGHSDDPNEFIHTAEQGGFPAMELDVYKDRMLTVSMVNIGAKDLHEEFEHWRSYGADGRGVGIVFSVSPKSVSKWVDYHLSPIRYKDTDAQWLRELPARIKAFQERERFNVHSSHRFFAKLYAFHKHTIYHRENEVRLLHYVKHGSVSGRPFSYEESEHRDLFPDLNRDGDVSWFTPLRMGKALDTDLRCSQNKELERQLHEITPALKVERIILGYRIGREQEDSLRFACSVLARRSLGYDVPFESSRFMSYFQRPKRQRRTF